MGKLEGNSIDCFAERRKVLADGSRINTTKDLAHPLGGAFFCRKLCRLKEVIEPDYASGNEKLGQQSLRVLLSLVLGERTYDHRNDDASVLLALAVTVVALHIAVDLSGMDRFTQQAWGFEAIEVELTDEIG